MHKTVSAAIGTVNFVIEESAYADLEKYLATIRAHFVATGDADEIIADIEARIAEEFTAKLTKNKKVIQRKDVDDVIRTMGTVEDFQEFAEEDRPAREPFDWRKIRLYRDADDRILGGVAAGIAHFFAIDPLIVRLLFGLSIFVGGFGVLLYILLWILLPEARTTTQKVEMTGGRVTLSAIQERIDRAIPPEKRNGAARKIIAFPFVLVRGLLLGIGRILRFLLPLLGRIVGFVAALGLLFAIAVLTFLLLALVLNPASPYIGIPLGALAGSAAYVFFLLAAYFIALVPVLFLLLLALSLTAMRSVFSAPTAGGLAGLWFLALVTAAFTGFSLAPKVQIVVDEYRREYEDTETRPYELADFTGIRAGGRAELVITSGEEFSVEAVAPRAAFDGFSLAVEEDMLVLTRENLRDPCILFCPSRRMTLHVTMPRLASLDLDGAVRATAEGVDEEAIDVTADGVSRLSLDDLTADILTLRIDGASHVIVSGTGTSLQATLDGVGVLSAYDYPVSDASVDIDGPARAMVDATGSLTGSIDGPGRIYHRSVPETLSVDINGPGRVIQQDEDRPERW